MARPIWKGSLQFGLVSINILLFSAVRAHTPGFRVLHKTCHTPITNKRWCMHCHKEVSWEDTVKGIKLPDGSFFILTHEALHALRPSKTQIIEILAFVDAESISPLYYDKHYYVGPQQEKDKAFFVLVAALKKFKRVALGRFVLRDKQYIAALTPYEDALLLSTLNYAFEIKHLPEIDELKPPMRVSKEELQLAGLLIDTLYTKKFNLEPYKDTFVTELQEAIRRKKKGIIAHVEEEQPSRLSLVDALKASLEQHQKIK